jgi:hypothetical protein
MFAPLVGHVRSSTSRRHCSTPRIGPWYQCRPSVANGTAALQTRSSASAHLLANAELRPLEGASHNVTAKASVPMPAEFFVDQSESVHRRDLG